MIRPLRDLFDNKQKTMREEEMTGGTGKSQIDRWSHRDRQTDVMTLSGPVLYFVYM